MLNLKKILTHLLKGIFVLLVLATTGTLLRTLIGKVIAIYDIDYKRAHLRDTFYDAFIHFIIFAVFIYCIYFVMKYILIRNQSRIFYGCASGLLSSAIYYILLNTLTIVRPNLTISIVAMLLFIFFMGLIIPYLEKLLER